MILGAQWRARERVTILGSGVLLLPYPGAVKGRVAQTE
jgi:hypothetical protein